LGEAALMIERKLRHLIGKFGHAAIMLGEAAFVVRDVAFLDRDIAFLDDEMLSVHLLEFRHKHGGVLEFGDLPLKVHPTSV
jgi:hypothetical protein